MIDNNRFTFSNPTILLLWYKEGINYGDFFIFNTVKNNIINSIKEERFKIKHAEIGLSYSILAKYAENVDFIWFCGG